LSVFAIYKDSIRHAESYFEQNIQETKVDPENCRILNFLHPFRIFPGTGILRRSFILQGISGELEEILSLILEYLGIVTVK
jgi:hypothetical protein